MDAYSALIFIHILLMVFWIGTDIGVFIAGFFMMDTRLSIPERQASIGLGMVIDRFPRLCFISILPVGLQLAIMGNHLSIDPIAMFGIWVAALIWLLAALVPMIRSTSPNLPMLHRVERVMQIATIAGLSCGGVWMLSHTSGQIWLAIKFFMLALVCLLVIFLEKAFTPPMQAFAEICTTGSTPDLEQKLRRGMTWTYVWVVGIYLAVLVAAYLGIAKPF